MLAANKSLKAEVDAACRNWAVKDLDCPAKGCFGFSFTLDKNFKLDGLDRRLVPHRRSSRPGPRGLFGRRRRRTTRVQPDKNGNELECYYPKLPPDCTAGPRQPKQGRAVGNRR